MQRLVLMISWFGFFLAPVYAANPPQSIDFQIQLYHGDDHLKNLWAVEVLPPKYHHFNLQAPRTAKGGTVTFETIRENRSSILFQSQNEKLTPGSSVEVSAFLCDEAKTYCMRKKMQVQLDGALAKTVSSPFQSKTLLKKKEKSLLPNTTFDAFIDNDVEKALKEAVQAQKPMLIDFYGIWCPPCNLYNETIFNTKQFSAYSKKFVLLKLDADDERSFELKSKFKVGGYPTLLVAKLKQGATSISELEELERIVGYFPPPEFFTRLDQVYLHRNETHEERWKQRLPLKWEAMLEQKQYQDLIAAVSSVQHSDPLFTVASIYRWVAEFKKSPEKIKSSNDLSQVTHFFLSLSKSKSKLDSLVIMHAVDFLDQEMLLAQKEIQKLAFNFIDELESRINRKTLYVSGAELTLADLQAMRMGLAETLKDQVSVSRYRKQALLAYEKLMKHFASQGHRELRSLNLEYAYLLWKDGRTQDAKKLYQKFIVRYPEEFTFYYAASKMYLELKELTTARELAEKALKYSYGDNRIRSLDRVLTVMKAQGQVKEAFARGTEFIKQLKQTEGLYVRTDRYVDTLKKTIQQLNGDQI
jgi:thiol-disulfide isomerase/thioredoxin